MAADIAAYCHRNAAGNAFLALSGLSFFVATVLVPLRAYVRLRIVKNFWWDDFCLIVSYLLLIPTFALLWQMAALGLGRHFGCYPTQAAVTAFELQYVAEVLEIFSTIFTRTSVALFVIRIFAVTQRVRRLLYGYTIFMIISLAVTGSLVFGQCTPAKALWNPELAPTAKCWSLTVRDFINYYNGAVSILSDLILALLPAYFLNKLQMQPSLKIALASLMAVGLVPAICAICRTALAVKQTEEDPLYSVAVLIVFGSLETSMLIIAATIPTLPPLFQNMDRKDSFSYFRRKMSFTLCRPTSNNLHTSQTKVSQARTYVKEPGGYSVGTTHSTPTSDQYQGPYDDGIFLMPLNSSGGRMEIGEA